MQIFKVILNFPHLFFVSRGKKKVFAVDPSGRRITPSGMHKKGKLLSLAREAYCTFHPVRKFGALYIKGFLKITFVSVGATRRFLQPDNVDSRCGLFRFGLLEGASSGLQSPFEAAHAQRPRTSFRPRRVRQRQRFRFGGLDFRGQRGFGLPQFDLVRIRGHSGLDVEAAAKFFSHNRPRSKSLQRRKVDGRRFEAARGRRGRFHRRERDSGAETRLF